MSKWITAETSSPSTNEAGEGEGEAGTNYREPAVRKGARVPTVLFHVFVYLSSSIICRLYKLTLSDKSPFIFATGSKLSFFFLAYQQKSHIKMSAVPPIPEGTEKNFSPRSEPAFGGPLDSVWFHF